MMKTYLSLTVALAIGSAATAQTCVGTRYASDVFTGVTATTGIVYGSNITYTGTTQSLTLDLYEPTGDVLAARPLIVWAHGGSFIGGTSADADVDSLSHRFARKGYVCASINYRIGVASFDSLGMIPAVLRAVQDMKASVRFFYKDRATTNTYKIDTNNIYIGGSSAGAITVLHYVYLKRTCQIDPYFAHITATSLTKLGGLDGYSGNQCYSDKVKGVISLCGALGVYGWMEAGDLPLCSMHGTADKTVPYGRAIVNPGLPIMYTDGSRMIYQQSLAVNVQNNFYTWIGAGHVPYAANAAYMDTTVNFVRDYLNGRMGITCTALQPADATSGTASLYAYTPCTTNVFYSCTPAGIQNYNENLFEDVYPNPSSSSINVVFSSNNSTHIITLSDITGRVIKSDISSEANYTLEKASLSSGIYFLRVANKQGETSVRKIIFN